MTDRPQISADNIPIYTYNPNDTHTLLREVHGRAFNNQNDIYALPSDDLEFERLNRQHYAIILSFLSLSPCPDQVSSLLSQDGTSKFVLDLGCGSGIWAVEMAHQYPHVQVLGIDLAPVTLDPSHIPPNCRFEVLDVNHGLERFEGQFDVIHCRCVGAGLADYEKTLKDIMSSLKPGGLAIIYEGDMTIYSLDGVTPVPHGSDTNPDGSWTARFTHEVYNAFIALNNKSGVVEYVDRGLWNIPLADPETCGRGSLYIPIGPHISVEGDLNTAKRLKLIGMLYQQNFLDLTRALSPFLLSQGIPKATVDDWCIKSNQELEAFKHRALFRLGVAWGRRSMDQPPFNVKQAYSDTLPQVEGFDYFRVFASPEEASKDLETRTKLAKENLL